jgi:hypothetical protein
VVITAKVGALALAALVLAGAGVGVALTRDDDEKVVAAPVEETMSSTSTTVAATTSSVPPTSATTTSVALTTTTRRTTTTARPTTTSTKPPATPVTCTPAQLEAKLTTGRPYYAAGQTMEFTTTLRNKTGAPCAYGGWAVQVLFKDEAGHTFPGVGVSASTLAGATLKPGEVLTHSGAWEHRACPEPACGPLPAGPAYVQVSWFVEGYVYDLTQSFILT